MSSSQDTETTICDNITGGGDGHYSVSVVHPINVKIESLKCFKLSKDLTNLSVFQSDPGCCV